jgi:hypothetical protein
VNVALPTIKTELRFSEENLQWVISAYAIIFEGSRCSAGGSRTSSGAAGCSVIAADPAGSSLLRSRPEASLIAFRALQGLGGALLRPRRCRS